MNMGEKKLGFIGVGAMGGPMAGRLVDAGYALEKRLRINGIFRLKQ